MTSLVLASQSSARFKLLQEAGFEVIPSPTDVNETLIEAQGASTTALARARAKGAVAALRSSKDWVVAADTVVESPQGDILDKPSSLKEARDFLKNLSASTHRVFSAAVIRRGFLWEETCESALVTLKVLNSKELDHYLSLDEWRGKAGGLCIQGQGAQYVEKVEGDPQVVVGLPMNWIVKFFLSQ